MTRWDLKREQDRNDKLREEIKRLKLLLYGDMKVSECCKAPLVEFISVNQKMCSSCKRYFDWNLKPGQKPGQKPLFKRDQDYPFGSTAQRIAEDTQTITQGEIS